jgi:hypothetical protein
MNIGLHAQYPLFFSDFILLEFSRHVPGIYYHTKKAQITRQKEEREFLYKQKKISQPPII